MNHSWASTDKSPDFDSIIPIRITSLRTFFGFSAIDLDRIAGFRAGTTRRLERGHQRVYTFHLIRICQATDISFNFFFELDAGTPHAWSGEQQEKFRLLSAFHSIDDLGVRRDIFELIESLGGQ
ncbi:MAG: hypothetical protein JKY17_00485 [Magnetovibrio sp.]|nr:hypothetical protein [Magnetovibrio sp.]